jgi:hypothetical protein
MSVFVCVDTSNRIGNLEHIKVFANADATEAWFAENEFEGAAFEYR